jgi:hypothetical protein
MSWRAGALVRYCPEIVHAADLSTCDQFRHASVSGFRRVWIRDAPLSSDKTLNPFRRCLSSVPRLVARLFVHFRGHGARAGRRNRHFSGASGRILLSDPVEMRHRVVQLRDAGGLLRVGARCFAGRSDDLADQLMLDRITPPSPISPGFSADRCCDPSPARRDTPVAAAGC